MPAQPRTDCFSNDEQFEISSKEELKLPFRLIRKGA